MYFISRLFLVIGFISVLIVPVLPKIGIAETLEEAWSAALAADHTIRAAERATESASEKLLEAKAHRFPKLRLSSAFIVLNNAPSSQASGLEIPVGEDKSLAYRAGVTVPVYTHFRTKRGIEAALSNTDAARHEEGTVRQNIKMEVAQAYVNVLLGISSLTVAESQEKNLAAHSHDVKNLYEEGLVAINDYLASEVALVNAKQQTLQVRNLLAIAKSTYNKLLGRSLNDAVKLNQLQKFPQTDTLESLTDRALKNRTELLTLEKQEESLQYLALAERAASGPHVAVNGGYSYNENRYITHEGVWAATIGLTWDIFDGGISRHKSLATKKQAESLTELRRDLRLAIALQVNQTWLDMNESRERIKVTKQALDQAEENLKVSRDRYQEGLGTNTEVLDAESLRTTSQVNHIRANYDSALATLRLLRTIGEL